MVFTTFVLPPFRIFKCNQLSRAATSIPVEIGEMLIQIWIALYILICASEVQNLSRVMFSGSKMNAKVRDLNFKQLKSASRTISCSKHILVHIQDPLPCDHIFCDRSKVDIDSGSLLSDLKGILLQFWCQSCSSGCKTLGALGSKTGIPGAEILL